MVQIIDFEKYPQQIPHETLWPRKSLPTNMTKNTTKAKNVKTLLAIEYGTGHICVSLVALEFCHDGSHQLSQEAKLTLQQQIHSDD